MSINPCHVCGEPAFVEVLLYDIYMEIPRVTMDRDFTCPFLCVKHMIENESGTTTSIGGVERDVTLGQIADANASNTFRRPPLFNRMTQVASPRPDSSSFAELAIEMRDAMLKRVNLTIPAVREARGIVRYPFSNQHGAQGFTIYRELPDAYVPDEIATEDAEEMGDESGE